MGIGGSGGGAEAAEYYLNQGNEVMVLSPSDESRNEQTRRNLEERGAIFITRQEAESEAGNADIVVKMPGIPVPYIIKKKARRIINDIAALLEDPRTERMKRIIILGSKGKTSTASAPTGLRQPARESEMSLQNRLTTAPAFASQSRNNNPLLNLSGNGFKAVFPLFL